MQINMWFRSVIVLLVILLLSGYLEGSSERDKRQISKEITCGKKKVRTQGLVLKGYATTPGLWPWHTAIFHIEGIQKHYACGGTLINEYQILTAAHCLINQNNGAELFPGSILIQLGAYDLTVNSPHVQEHKATYIDVHENYNSLDHKNDIAIITLATKVKYTAFVQPACIWDRDVNELSKQGITGTAVGWGITENDKSSPTLKAANLPIVGFHDCLQSNREVFGQFLTEDNFCGGYRNGTIVCNGDSGGGLFVYYQKTWFVAGIISFSALSESGSLFCSPKDYGVFVNLPRFKDWIVKERNHGTRFLPINKVINPVVYKANKNVKLRLADIKCHEYGALQHASTTKQRFYVSKIQAYKGSVFLSEGHMISEFYFITVADGTYLEKPDLAKKATGSPLQIYNVEKTIIHPDYKHGLLDNNLALVKVKEEFKYHGFSRIICLNTNEIINSRDLVTDYADQQINFASDSECEYRKRATRKFALTNRTTEFCTDVCLNIELLIRKTGSEYLYLTGLIADCGEEEIEPGIFTNLTKFLDWIESIVWK